MLQGKEDVIAQGMALESLPPLRIPRREVEVALPPEYPGFTYRLWVNFPSRLNDEINSGDQGRIVAALRRIVLAHNGWQDDEGGLLPQPTEAEFWERIPTELAAVIVATINAEIVKLPNSLRPRRAS